MCKVKDCKITEVEKLYGYGSKKDTQEDITYREEGREQADYTDDKMEFAMEGGIIV